MRRLVGISILAAFFLPGITFGERIVFLGDSLTAGYGLDPEFAYPRLVEKFLSEKGRETTVVNAGLSGDTTAGGLRRMDWILRQEMDVLIIALGANDALRGFPVSETRENLVGMINKARSTHPDLRIILAGMMAPPNMGADYRREFDALYACIAREESVELMPFLLEGVAGEPSLNLPDGIHPNRQGHERIARQVVEIIEQ